MDEQCLEGGGCFSPFTDCEAGAGISSRDSGTPIDSGFEVIGYAGGRAADRSCGCDTVLGGWSALAWVLVVVLLRRRLAGALLLALALGAVSDARAQDVRTWIQLDGGPLPGFVEPTPQARWALRTAVSVMRVQDPVVLRTSRGAFDVLRSLDTYEAAASLRLANWFRVGLSVPYVRLDLVSGERAQVLAPAVFLLREVSDDVVMQIVIVPRQQDTPPFAHQPSFTFGLTGRRDLSVVDGLARLQFKGQWPVRDIGGVVWGPRIEGAVGAVTKGRVRVGAQLVASAPSQLVGVPPRGAWPLEAVASLSGTPLSGLHADLLVGAGLTRGLGASRVRVGLGLRATPSFRDRDGDRVVDALDQCVDVPEDRDHFHDHDGCPDPDNDRDGLLDASDRCPDDPETFNGYADDDGCPDDLARLVVDVSSPVGFEQVYIAVADDGGWQIDGRRVLEVPPGQRVVKVRAAGHRDLTQLVDVPEEGVEVDLLLRPIRVGSCDVAVRSADGAPLAAQWATEHETFDIPAGGASLALPVGTYEGPLRSGEHLEDWVALDVPDGPCAVVWTLTPRDPSPPIRFVVDSAALSPDSRAALDRLAAWLRDHPEVRLLRVMGHADDQGSPAYNYDLSLSRARSVVEALVERGIDGARLLPSGDGESRAELQLGEEVAVRRTDAPLREVRFTIVVWDESRMPAIRDAPSPATPPTSARR